MFSIRRRSTPPPSVTPTPTTLAQDTPPQARVPADRTAHLDDHHLVFWNAGASEASATHLSEAAAAWQQAVSKQPAVPPRALPTLK